MREAIIIAVIGLLLLAFASIEITKREAEIFTLKSEKLELLKKLNEEKEEVIQAKKDLIEARELLSDVFMEAMADRELFNELKKSKCKGKR